MLNVSYDDFAKLDIKVAKIIAVEWVEGKTVIIKEKNYLRNDDLRVVIIEGDIN